ncbi:MAG: GDP-mannose 4,6-dehydratase, partial [Spirochaetes bacterium]|nr:GDP-mannose 4,6-dehydratase [Spirochaetota bacterium]
LEAKRDWGYAKEFVEGMWLMLQQDKPDDYVLGTGEAHSVRELVEETAKLLDFDLVWKGKAEKEEGIERKTGKTMIRIDPYFYRPTEVDALIADYSKAKKMLNWEPKVKFKELIKIMVESDYTNEKKNIK